LPYLPAISAFSGGLATGWQPCWRLGAKPLSTAFSINRFDAAITD
jgi:hypothetical protein